MLLLLLAQGLAKSIAWDGEGATCLLEIDCVGAQNDADARKVGASWLEAVVMKLRL